MAFGPFLCIGLLLGAMFGEEITEWYIRSFLQQPEVITGLALLLP